jgi:dolichol-phosphate mannosyltransferase
MAARILIFIPTYNERENVRRMAEEVRALGLDADLLFMDDNSPDGTGAVLDELAAQDPRVGVVHRSAKSGIGSAHLDGIALAYDKGYDRLVTLDCDFTHSPSLIPEFLNRSDDADLVIGSRYLEQGSLPGWSLMRKSLTTLGHLLTQALLGISEDATGAFRVYNLRTIPRELFGLVRSRGYAFFFESLLIVQRNGYRIAQVPITLPARTYGSSKMSMIEVRRSVSTLVTLFLQDQTDPRRFKLSRPRGLEPGLVDPQNWNEYWNKKSGNSTAAYDLVATVYRDAIIRRRLESAIRREFEAGAKLLHAGCGSGQVDARLHQHASITAVDISSAALDLYRSYNPHAEEVRHASILDLPFAEATFDGAYNLGVVEHFKREELTRAFSELHRVIKPKGKLVVFWPHARATSVMFLNTAHWLLNDVLQKEVQLHPPEYSLLHSKREAAELLASGGFELTSYDFGPRDMFVQAVVVGTRR